MIAHRTLFIAGVGLALILALVISPFASASPDGLERVAAAQGIEAAEKPLWTASPIPDYATPGVDHKGLATAAAGVIGILVVLALALGLGRLLVRRAT